MNIGIIVYSQTGNTLSVARKAGERLEAGGHSTTVEQVAIEGEANPGTKDIKFSHLPSVDGYDALIFGAPVQAFSLAGPMTAYLGQLPSLGDRPVACFVTKQLPFSWTGGNRAIRTMKRFCEARGATVRGTGIVFWTRSRREASIAKCVDALGSLFSE